MIKSYWIRLDAMFKSRMNSTYHRSPCVETPRGGVSVLGGETHGLGNSPMWRDQMEVNRYGPQELKDIITG
jgi:hypothetical protein